MWLLGRMTEKLKAATPLEDGLASYQLVGGVTAYQGDDR